MESGGGGRGEEEKRERKEILQSRGLLQDGEETRTRGKGRNGEVKSGRRKVREREKLGSLGER